MANKKRKDEIRQVYQRKAKEQQYEAATKKLFIFPIIALALSVLILLLLFVNFVDIYNTTPGVGVENKVSGWSFAMSALTGKFTSPESIYDDMAMPFYYYAAKWCESVAIFALLSVIVIILNAAVQVVAIVKRFHILNCVSAILSFVTAALLIVCFAQGLAMKNGEILSTFCSGNPACSIRSFAIFPALFAVGSCVVSTYATVKYMKAAALLN